MAHLKNYILLGDKCLNYITKMLYKVFVIGGFEALFYKVTLKLLKLSFIDLYDLILHSTEDKLIKIQKLIQYISKKMVKDLTEYPILFVEVITLNIRCCFPKIMKIVLEFIKDRIFLIFMVILKRTTLKIF